ncbi:MAG: complex I NDUFA9 subunit family protein [Aquabacterium sp.]|nr:complex I NDUFA9 subunit family protein [Aquabacterium sp.]
MMTNNESPTWVVTGGTGFVGRHLCARLAARRPDAIVRVPTRRLVTVPALAPLPSVQLVRADVHDVGRMQAVLQGAQALVHLVAVLHGDAQRFERTHVALPRALVQACRAAGVQRVVHVSALGVSASAPSDYLRSKAAGEAVWRDSGLDVTILRPSVIFGEDDRFTRLFAGLLALAPVFPLAGADARFQPVWVGDVAEAIARCLERPQTIGEVIECAGPREMTLREVVQAAGRMSGHPRPVISLPDALARLQAAVLQCLPGEPLMSADNLRSMQVPNVATRQHPGLEALDIVPQPLERLSASFAR